MDKFSSYLKDYILGPAHVGFVVEDLEAALADARRFYGVSKSDISRLPAPGEEAETRFAFFEVGGLQFEYIQPCSDAFRAQLLSPPSGGGGINHLAWRVRDIHGAVEALSREGIVPGYVTPDGVVSLGRKLMVYLDPESTGGLLVELIEQLDGADE